VPPIMPSDPGEPTPEPESAPPSSDPGEPLQPSGQPLPDPEYFAARVVGDLRRQVTSRAIQFVMRTCGWIPPEGREFIELAPSILAEKLLSAKKRPDFGRSDHRFLGWAEVSLANDWNDRGRRYVRRPRQIVDYEFDDRPAPGGEPSRLDQEVDPYPKPILDQIGRWKRPIQRVGLLTYVWVWKRIPSDLWNAWVRECGLKPPFPPEEILVWQGVRAWHQSVADALGMTPRQLTLVLTRNQHLLEDLPQIPWLSPDNTLPGSEDLK
jgi:hypothetical protein